MSRKRERGEEDVDELTRFLLESEEDAQKDEVYVPVKQRHKQEVNRVMERRAQRNGETYSSSGKHAFGS